MEVVKKVQLSEEEKYFEILYGKNKGWICRAENGQAGFKQHHYKYLDLLKQELNGENIFISLNTFYRTYKKNRVYKRVKC